MDEFGLMIVLKIFKVDSGFLKEIINVVKMLFL